ncbi:MAG TPA: hypothetical protein VGR81_00005, partial [Candidatus Acidoferrales bacterium]|nr:hypothetical protein [Candidatus Acidoferrales bacterium]
YHCAGQDALNPTLLKGLRWLLSDDALDPARIRQALESSDAIFRKFGAAAAARLHKQQKEPLVCASAVPDPDISIFASRLLAG